jgi:hypothetical protein
MAEPRQLRPLIRQQFSGRAPGADYTTEGCLQPTRLLTPDVTASAASPQLTVPQEERN